jgi:hypothetical protein
MVPGEWIGNSFFDRLRLGASLRFLSFAGNRKRNTKTLPANRRNLTFLHQEINNSVTLEIRMYEQQHPYSRRCSAISLEGTYRVRVSDFPQRSLSDRQSPCVSMGRGSVARPRMDPAARHARRWHAYAYPRGRVWGPAGSRAWAFGNRFLLGSGDGAAGENLTCVRPGCDWNRKV